MSEAEKAAEWRRLQNAAAINGDRPARPLLTEDRNQYFGMSKREEIAKELMAAQIHRNHPLLQGWEHNSPQEKAAIAMNLAGRAMDLTDALLLKLEERK